jgi:hypothetical protein
MQQFPQFITLHLFMAQHVSGILTPIIRSSTTAVEASGFTYFHKRYCFVNLQLKRDKRFCFAKFTVTTELIQLFCYLSTNSTRFKDTAAETNKTGSVHVNIRRRRGIQVTIAAMEKQ